MKAQLEDLVMQMYGGGITYSEAVREFKKAFLVTVLKEHNGNQCKAALDLKVHRNSLARTISDLQLDVRALRPGSRRPPGRQRLVPGREEGLPLMVSLHRLHCLYGSA